MQYALVCLKIKGLPTDCVTAELKEFGATAEDYGARIDDWLRGKNKSEIATLIDHVKSLPTPSPPAIAIDEEAERLRKAQLARIASLYLSGLSISKVAACTLFGRTTVRKMLVASGITLRTQEQQRIADMIAEDCPLVEERQLLAAIRKVRSL